MREIILTLTSALILGAPMLAQCGSAELARMNHLASAFQNDVTVLDSLSPDETHAFRTMAHDCTLAITTRAQREGKSDFHDLSKDDLILLYWISVMDDTASTMRNLRDAQKTDVPGAGPCTNVPVRYDKLEERLAWFYGCMHKDPPSIAEIRAKIAALPPEKRNALEKQDFATQEALLGVASYDLPIQVFPK